MENKVGIDSNVLTYMVEVMEPAYDPARDLSGLANERVSALRIFLYRGFIHVVPIVSAEYQKIRDGAKWQFHEGLSGNLLLDGGFTINQNQVDTLTTQFKAFHKSPKDCAIVAEAENIGLDYLLTNDIDLLKNLGPKTKVRLQRPSEFWASLAIKPGTNPRTFPHHTNPLSAKKWWVW